MVPVEMVVDVAERYLGVLGADLDLNGVFLSKEMKLLQGPLEVLDLSED
jgi:hypothetical protein